MSNHFWVRQSATFFIFKAFRKCKLWWNIFKYRNTQTNTNTFNLS